MSAGISLMGEKDLQPSEANDEEWTTWIGII